MRKKSNKIVLYYVMRRESFKFEFKFRTTEKKTFIEKTP